jgi:hypothetical protein
MAMQDHDDENTWVRTSVWLVLGNGHRIQVRARKLCRLGGFLEYTGPVWDRLLEIVFPQPDISEGGYRTHAMVARQCPDGIWVRFTKELPKSSVKLVPR